MRAVPITPRQVMFTVCGQCPSLHAEGLKNGMATIAVSILYKLTNSLQQQTFACLLLLLGGNTRPHDSFSVMLPSLPDLNVNHTAACTGKKKTITFKMTVPLFRPFLLDSSR